MKNIKAYIDGFPPAIRQHLDKVYITIKQTIPEADETISYGIPTFKINGKNIVHFAAFKHHIGFYPAPSCINHFRAELVNFKTSKGAIQFSFDKKIPYRLIRQMTAFRKNEIKM